MSRAGDYKWLPSDTPALLRLDEVCGFLRISKTTAHRLIHEEVLPAFRVGHSFRVRAEDLDDYLSITRTGDEQ